MSGIDVLTELDHDVGESIKLVSKRELILKILADERLSKPELVERVDSSRSTIDRAIRALEEAGYVTRKRSGYETTVVGRLARKRYQAFLAEEQTISDAMAVLSGLPDKPALPMSLCQQGTAKRFDVEYELFEQLAADLREADRYRAILPEVVDSRQIRLCHRLALEDELDVELLVDRDRLRRLGYEYPTLCAELADAGALRALEESPPFALSMVGGHRDAVDNGSKTTLRVISDDEEGGGVGILETTADEPVEWGEQFYRSRRQESQPGDNAIEAVAPAAKPASLADGGLPLSLRSEGIVRVDADHAEDVEPMEPTTAWRAGLGLAEVQAGYALPRRSGDDSDAEWLADQLFEQLHGESPIALLGPPGCGKSTVCKQVACDWPQRTGGTVLYRESGRGDPLDSIATLQQIIEREQRTGPVLVVVEDAVRAEANAIFELLDQLQGSEDVFVLLDARTGEWTDPEEFPIDARLEAIRQEGVTVTHVPRLTNAECERFVEQVETLTDRELAVSPTEILDEIHEMTRETVGGDEHAIAGEVFLLFHRLARTFEPLDHNQSTTVLEAHVERIRAELANRGETALAVGIVANVCNAAGLKLDAAYLYIPALAEAGDHVDVQAALEVLEDECLFDQPGTSAYRGIHESWSVIFLEQVLSETTNAAMQFGRALTRLLWLADKPQQRSELIDTLGETPALSEITLNPTAWVEETVEAIFELGRTHPKLAALFETGDASSIRLPESSPDRLGQKCLIWLGRICYNAGLYDRSERIFDQLPADGTDAELELRLGLASIAEKRGEFETARTHAVRGKELAGTLGDIGAKARSERLLGTVAENQGKYDAAQEHLERSQELCERNELWLELSRVLNELGNVARNTSELDSPEEYYRRSLEIEEKRSDRREKAASLHNLGNSAWRRGELNRAEEYYRRSLEIEEELGDRQGKARSLDSLGLVAWRRGELNRAKKHHRQSLAISEELGDRQGKALSFTNLGIVAQHGGDLDRAQEYFQRSLEVSEELDDKQGEARSLGNLGVTTWHSGELEQAREYHQRSLEIYDELGDRHGKSRSLGNLGDVAQDRGEIDRAEQYHRQTLEISEGLNDKHGKVEAHLNLGIVAIRSTDCSRAREHLEMAQSISQDVGDTQLEVKAKLYVGVVAHLRDDRDRAQNHLTDAIDRAEMLETPIWQATALGILGAVEIATGATAEGRERCEDALDKLREEAPVSTPRGVEVLWQQIVAERERKNDERARQLYQRTETWIDETGGNPGWASHLVDQHQEELLTDSE
jgi:tetratricopeptide (TPR) repeat protein/predicted transcriptional regulator/energy-coupling factor transporter ATP-binding protein EcfA2